MSIALKGFFFKPTDAQVNYLKNKFTIYIKIDIKTAPTCFGAATPSSQSAHFCLLKLQLWGRGVKSVPVCLLSNAAKHVHCCCMLSFG